MDPMLLLLLRRSETELNELRELDRRMKLSPRKLSPRKLRFKLSEALSGAPLPRELMDQCRSMDASASSVEMGCSCPGKPSPPILSSLTAPLPCPPFHPHDARPALLACCPPSPLGPASASECMAPPLSLGTPCW